LHLISKEMPMPANWKLLYGSAIGSSHERAGEPCQDYAHGRVFLVGTSPVLIVACADGAGSASHAQIGAKLACLTFLHAVSVSLEDGLRVADITQWHILQWYEKARRRLSLEACVCNKDLRDFACTLLTAIVSDDTGIFSQIGDGVIVIREGDCYQAVFWPQSGEYANTTYFLTGADFGERLTFRSLGQRVDELALLTDGLQPLALHYASRAVHAPFFVPMFQSLRQNLNAEELEGPLRQFLNSQPVNDRTDDDKTLFLATRRLSTDDSP
jgi:Protein phosphatase 2C